MRQMQRLLLSSVAKLGPPATHQSHRVKVFTRLTALNKFANRETLSWKPFRTFSSDVPPYTELAMPSLSPTMTQGNITAWKKSEGDSVGAGDILAEIETDKATIEWESQEDGFLAKILKGNGSKDIEVGAAVAILVEEEESVPRFKDFEIGAGRSGTSDSASKSTPDPSPKSSSSESADASEEAKAPQPAKSKRPPHQVLAMPALSPTMTQGNISTWQKKPGDAVAAGDVLCEVETDKATMAWESQDEGFLAKILHGNGSKDISVGTPVAVIVEDEDSIAAFENVTEQELQSGKQEPAEERAPPSQSNAPSSSESSKDPKPQPAPPAIKSQPSEGGRLKASPYARKQAAESGVELGKVTGTGPGGRIVAADVQKASSTVSKEPESRHGPQAAEYEDLNVSQIKKVTAERLLTSKQTIPHYYLTTQCKMDTVLSLRKDINDSLGSDGGKLSVNDFVVKAAALALKKIPAMNSSWKGDFIRQYKNIDINVAVQTPSGLMVPFVQNADKKGLLSISQEVKNLASKAKEGKLKPSEYQGGTFSISNLGMFGVKQFAAIINPPQSGILAVGSVTKTVLSAENGTAFGEAQVMLVTLSCDHRVVDGALGAEWLQAFQKYIENPLTMLI